MAITPIKKNRYLVDVRIYKKGKRVRIRKIFNKKIEAKNFESDANKANRDKNSRNAIGISTRTINEMADHYLSLVRYASLRDGSKLRNKQLIKHFLNWCEENSIRYVHEFNKDYANKYCAYIHQKWTGKGRQHVFIVAKMLFREEILREDAVVAKNPFPDKSPFKAKNYKPIAIPNELYNKLRENMSPLELAIFDIMIFTGCRSSELLYLCWNQVEKDAVRFEEHLILDKNIDQYIEYDTKTGLDRTVALNNTSKARFEYLRSITGNYQYVLPDECREIRHWITRRFEKIKKLTVAKFPDLDSVLFSKDKNKNITPKRLRSTFITNMIKVTKNPVIAQKAAGHSSIQTTLKHYTDMDFFDIKSGIEGIDFGE